MRGPKLLRTQTHGKGAVKAADSARGDSDNLDVLIASVHLAKHPQNLNQSMEAQ